jgi:nicotinate-nucleotide adenylyltransferase
MLQASIEGESKFALDLCEIHRAGTSYTVDTVEEIRQREGQAEYFFFIGDDNVAKLETWHRFNELRELVQFVVLSRGNTETTHYPIIRRQIAISATEIRNRVATGRSIRYFVPPAVEEIIRCRRIYQEQDK